MSEHATLTAAEQDSVRKKTLWQFAGMFFAAVSLAGTLHATYVVPAILEDARHRWEKDILEHASHPHPDAVSRAEFVATVKSLELRISDLTEEIRELRRELREK